MNSRRFIKSLTPPIFLELYRKLRYGNENKPYTWEGIYEHYKEVPVTEEGFEGFNGNLRAKAEANHTQGLIERSREYRTIPTDVTGENILLPLLVSLACKSDKKVRILDFGGGTGIQYVHLVNSLVKFCEIDYKIVELENACNMGSDLFKENDQIQFLSQLPEELPEIDVIYMKSVLQYIEDYAGLLRRMCAYKAKYILFVKLSAGDNPTYATLQKNVPGMEYASWCINVDEIINVVSENGFSLIYKSTLDVEHNQDNFPESYRMGPPCNLLFKRN